MKALLIGLIILVIACFPSPTGQSIVSPQDSTRHIQAPTSTGLPAGFRQVVRTRELWDSLWTLLVKDRTDPEPDPPSIDFTRDQLLVAGMGRFANGGFSIRIDSVLAHQQGLMVYVRSEYGCLSTDVVSAPVDIVRVPKRFATVRFVNQRVVRGTCGEFYRDHPG